jgi:hypothetical protein
VLLLSAGSQASIKHRATQTARTTLACVAAVTSSNAPPTSQNPRSKPLQRIFRG